MTRSPKTLWVNRFALCVGLVLTMAVVALAADAALPSSVASRVKKINAALDQVDKALELDRMTTAERKLTEANKTLKQINDRYAGKFDEKHADYKAMTDRLTATTAKVEAASKGAAAADAADKATKAANEALCQEWIDKLDPFIDRGGDQYLRIGSDFNSASPEDQAKSKAAYARAKVLWAEYQKVTIPDKTRDLLNVESSLASSLRYYGHEETAEAQAVASKEWVDKLGPFVGVGVPAPKRLIASPTVDAEQVKKLAQPLKKNAYGKYLLDMLTH